MFEKRYSDCMLVILGYETYYHDGDGYSHTIDQRISVSKGATLEGFGASVRIIGIGFSRVKAQITYNGKTTVHELKKGDKVFLDSYDRSHGADELAHIEQKELCVRLVKV